MFIFLTSIFCLIQVHALPSITEVMYNPFGSDNNKEYIELLTNNISLENYTFHDFSSVDNLKLLKQSNSSYVLIVEEGFNHTNINATIYTTGATIGNNLNNNHDLVLFMDGKKIVDALTYTNTIGGNNDNQSLCRQARMLFPCPPTPGKPNVKFYTPSANYTLKITEILPNPFGDDRSAAPEGEWIEVYNYGKQPLNLVGLTLQDARNTTFILSDVHFQGTAIIPQKQYKTIYLNGKSLLNNNGFESLTLKNQQDILTQASYTDSKEGLSWSRTDKNLFVYALPTPGEKNNFLQEQLQTNISITNIYAGKDRSVRFGESFRVKLAVYKADTTKNQLKLYIPNLTKQTRINVYDQYITISMTVPLQLIPNCNNKYASGKYPLILDGLGQYFVTNVSVSGITSTLCPKNSTQKVVPQKHATTISLKTPQKQQETVVSDTFINNQTKIVYTSNDVQAQRYALHFFCLVLLMIIGATIFTKD